MGPRLDWARGKISLLDGACGKLETIVAPIIVTADKCIDTSVEKVSMKVSAVQTSVANRIAPVQAKIGEVQGALMVRSLDLVDSSESLIDRLLPLPSKAMQTQSEQEEKQAKAELLMRVARLPFAVPLRVTMIMYVKGNGAVEAVLLSGRQFVNIAMDKQGQFAQQVMQRAKPLTDKVSGKVVSITAPAMQRVRAGKDSAVQTLSDGRQVVVVKVNNMVIKLHLVEIKDWSVEKASSLRSNTMAVVMAVVRTAQGTTTRVIGQNRATTLFSKLNLPIEPEIQKADAQKVEAQKVQPKKVETQKVETRIQRPVNLEKQSKPLIQKAEPKLSSDSSILATIAQDAEGAIAG